MAPRCTRNLGLSGNPAYARGTAAAYHTWGQAPHSPTGVENSEAPPVPYGGASCALTSGFLAPPLGVRTQRMVRVRLPDPKVCPLRHPPPKEVWAGAPHSPPRGKLAAAPAGPGINGPQSGRGLPGAYLRACTVTQVAA